MTPSDSLSADHFSYRELRTADDVAILAAPLGIAFEPPGLLSLLVAETGSASAKDLRGLRPSQHPITPEELAASPFIMTGEMTTYGPGGNPLLPPVIPPGPYIGLGSAEEAHPTFTGEAAKLKSIELWNKVLAGAPSIGSGSVVQTMRAVFSRFSAVVKRKSFLERRIHRFLNDHRALLLPPFTNCLFEHSLYSGAEERKADFILERGAGFPALLIELESPTHKVFRADGHLTAPASHAVAQISDWVRIIDQDSARNASGRFSFLAGPKERLVVIGRGLEHREQMLNSRFSGTTIWTYDLLLEEARGRWNNQLAEQYRILGLPELRPF